jgi:hypothetical protein
MLGQRPEAKLLPSSRTETWNTGSSTPAISYTLSQLHLGKEIYVHQFSILFNWDGTNQKAKHEEI